jgi:NAD(P)-dependent dehydrogenase (short-subunit alcohol dehydrogenase family)
VTARILVTGATDGVGLAAAQELIAAGYSVVAHARTAARANDVAAKLDGSHAILVADFAEQVQVLSLAEQVNAIGRFDAVIHNAGIGSAEPRRLTADGVEHVLAINALAPYLLTCLIDQPGRLIYVTSGQHLNGSPTVDDLNWESRRWDPLQAYADSKLFESTLAFAVARLWPEVVTNTLEPGWVPTKMANYDAPDDISLGHVTQVWLATSDAPEAVVSGGYYYHQQAQLANPVARSERFQEDVLTAFAKITGVTFPRRA